MRPERTRVDICSPEGEGFAGRQSQCRRDGRVSRGDAACPFPRSASAGREGGLVRGASRLGWGQQAGLGTDSQTHPACVAWLRIGRQRDSHRVKASALEGPQTVLEGGGTSQGRQTAQEATTPRWRGRERPTGRPDPRHPAPSLSLQDGVRLAVQAQPLQTLLQISVHPFTSEVFLSGRGGPTA